MSSRVWIFNQESSKTDGILMAHLIIFEFSVESIKDPSPDPTLMTAWLDSPWQFSVITIYPSSDSQPECSRAVPRSVDSSGHHHLFESAADVVVAEEILMAMEVY